MRALVNPSVRPERVAPASGDAAAFHARLAGYAPTPLRALSSTVALKDESDRLGLPAFKVLGASWAIERALREHPDVHTLVTASTGNHGRAVAHMAARRGVRCRVFLPSRSAAARREAIAGEGAELVVVDGVYEDAVAAARADGARDGAIEIADVGSSGPAHWVIDGYACLTASLAAGEPTVVATTGTTMSGLDCAEVSPAAWPSLRDGIHGMVTVSDAEAHAAMRELAAAGLAIGDSGASGLAALRALAVEEDCAELRDAIGLNADSRVVLIGTEGATDPEGYARRVPG